MIKPLKSIVKIIFILILISVFLLAIKSTPSHNNYEAKIEKKFSISSSDKVNLTRKTTEKTSNGNKPETINLSKGEIDQTLNEINFGMIGLSNEEIDQTLKEINYEETSNTDKNYPSLIKKGMHRIQVRKIKGPPIRTKNQNNQVLWIYKNQEIIFSKPNNKVITIISNN